MSSRLFQEVREKRGLVYSIYSFSAPYLDGGLFGIYAGTGESEAEELMPVTLEELRKVQSAVTEQELARARAQVKASLLMSLESTGSRTEQLARQLQVFGRVVPTEETVAVKLAVVAPAAAVTVVGTATAALLLDRLTAKPPLPAAAFRVTVQLSVPAPVREPLPQLKELNTETPVPLRFIRVEVPVEELLVSVS